MAREVASDGHSLREEKVLVGESELPSEMQ